MPHTKPRVLVTRPETLARSLIQALESIGAQVFHVPLLEIKFLENSSAVKQAIEHLTDYTWQIFVSRHAVQAVMPQILASWSMLDLKSLHWACVGPGTAKELARFIDTDIIYPQTGLGAVALHTELADKIQLSDTMLVWCGDKPQGSWPNAHLVTCYQREKNITKLTDLQFDYVIITSGTSLECLDVKNMHHGKLIVISERLVLLAKTLGFKGQIILAQGANEQSIIQAIKGDLT